MSHSGMGTPQTIQDVTVEEAFTEEDREDDGTRVAKLTIITEDNGTYTAEEIESELGMRGIYEDIDRANRTARNLD